MHQEGRGDYKISISGGGFNELNELRGFFPIWTPQNKAQKSNRFLLLTIFAKSSILDVWLGSEYASE